jgi:mannose-6-phosphate isomerase-like protein (cupin superfamily)
MRAPFKIGLAVLSGLLAFPLGSTPIAVSADDSHSAGAATDVTNAEIQATLQKSASVPVIDQALRIVSINGEYNVALAIVHRSKASASSPSGAIEHSQITEVYHVVSGTATLVTGGVMPNPQPFAPDSDVVRVLAGPSTRGDKIQGGVSRQVGPGDVIIIPPNTPHWFSEIASDQIVYLVVRMDPKKLLPAGFTPK